jgi:hypothetical protein
VKIDPTQDLIDESGVIEILILEQINHSIMMSKEEEIELQM